MRTQAQADTEKGKFGGGGRFKARWGQIQPTAPQPWGVSWHRVEGPRNPQSGGEPACRRQSAT